MSQQLKRENRDHEKQWDNVDSNMDEISVDNLPPRKEAHKKNSQAKSRMEKRKKKTRIRFPLVRIWLFLFLLLVALVTTYPWWG
ncbi:hypothetical protein [Salipaludibacillus daqingensis]|uniref:hypothetical protein n=1 Tax=Salipaludibacillus daqingensis TaxID=3041001 RepID=UPI0024759953|nr:hypothetical protein [Salipaludibacillus daqingensis]